MVHDPVATCTESRGGSNPSASSRPACDGDPNAMATQAGGDLKHSDPRQRSEAVIRGGDSRDRGGGPKRRRC
eukprot:2160845-Prymnesium_polylepis.1